MLEREKQELGLTKENGNSKENQYFRLAVGGLLGAGMMGLCGYLGYLYTA